MKKIDLGQTITIVANLGVIVGIVFLAFELRQNTIAARASAYQQLGVSTSETWYSMARDRELNDLVMGLDSADDYMELSRSDQLRIQSYTLGNLRLFETAFLQVQQGLLQDSALRTLGWEQYAENSTLLRASWPEIKSWVTPEFASYLEGYGFSSE